MRQLELKYERIRRQDEMTHEREMEEIKERERDKEREKEERAKVRICRASPSFGF